MQAEIIVVISDGFSKQQVNFSLFLSNWYCQKLGWMDLLGYDRKVTSDKKMIFISDQRCKGEDYCNHFLVTLETKDKFFVVFVILILGKAGVNGVTRQWQEIDTRYEFDFSVVLKSLGWK